ncbi:hypothetical protein [Streptococcus acidominimus]|uniref:Uncharacterized protein n=1 Tax=Streptococcus acidominimus TaxID=1326 RepID=A0A1Q8EDA1_STRAI|nr:hypothetical protein [Streptococcus acidominimus]OLF49752.1 hypothetical protein BU200_05655 [Streptococcus acidominimus]QBX07891.1 hypothetical protein JavanS2_0011 [Streptococcus satellite phage Javan2]SUN06035.1 Uncharacterised protein [Streptococcus acidominimus]
MDKGKILDNYEDLTSGMMIDYDDVKAQLIDLVTVSDMALSLDDRNSSYATLNIMNMAIQQLVDKLEERDNHAR